MRLTKQKTDNLYMIGADRYTRWHEHSVIIGIDDNLVWCLKEYVPIINTYDSSNFEIELFNCVDCGIYKFRDQVHQFISNYDSYSESNDLKCCYIEVGKGEWDTISDYNDAEDVYLIINPKGYFYYRLISLLDEDGGTMIYETAPLKINWFLNNYEDGLFKDDI